MNLELITGAGAIFLGTAGINYLAYKKMGETLKSARNTVSEIRSDTEKVIDGICIFYGPRLGADTRYENLIKELAETRRKTGV